MKETDLKLACTLPADAKRVFRALTDAKELSAWSGHKGKVEARIGGKFEMFNGWTKGKVLAYQEGKALAYTWHTTDWAKEATPSIVAYTLTPAARGTRVVLSHTGFPNEKERNEHLEGWKQHVFEPLKEYLRANKA